MTITTAEFLENHNKYLTLLSTEDIYVTDNGRLVAKISNPYQDRIDLARSLFGIIPADITPEEAREERLDQI